MTESRYESGFNNYANFNRQFKEITGVTPAEYLKNIYLYGHPSADDRGGYVDTDIMTIQ